MGKPPKPITIQGVTYSSQRQARKALDVPYYRLLELAELGAENIPRSECPITINGVTYPSRKLARFALEMSKKEFQTMYGKVERERVFPAEIEGRVFETLEQARDALGYNMRRLYYLARKGKR